MRLTRRDTIKSILSAAALSAVPAVAEAAIAAKPPTKAESIYAKIKELISQIEATRGFPLDGEMDFPTIALPPYCDRKEIAACFFKDFPEFKISALSFNNFQSWDCLIVDIAHASYRPKSEDQEVMVNLEKTYWAIEFLGDSEVHGIGCRDYYPLPPTPTTTPSR